MKHFCVFTQIEGNLYEGVLKSHRQLHAQRDLIELIDNTQKMRHL